MKWFLQTTTSVSRWWGLQAVGSKTHERCCWHLVIYLLMCVTAACASTQMHTYLFSTRWQRGGLARRQHLSAHPYDIIWHWSSCLPSPPPLLPLPSSSPPFVCSQPAMEGMGEWVPNSLLCSRPLFVSRHKHAVPVSRLVPIFLFPSVSFILLSTHHLCLQIVLSHFPLVICFRSHPSPPACFSLILRLSHCRQFQFTTES